MSTNLREARASAHAAAVRFLAENNKTAFDKAIQDVDKLTEEINRSESRSAMPDLSSYNFTSKDKDRQFAFAKWLRGMQLTDVEKRSVERRDVAEGVPLTTHIGTYTGLGFLVPTGFAGQIEQATKWFAPLLSVFGRMDTSTGNPLPYPISNDTATLAVLVSEAANNAESDGAGGNFGTSQINFGAWKYSSGLVKMSLELLQD